MAYMIVSGASRGIGYETVKSLVKEGKKLLALARSKEKLDELKRISPLIESYVIDLESAEEILEFSHYLQEKKIKVNGLLNNAGSLINKAFMELSDSDWNRMFQSNLMSAVHLSKAVIPYMERGSHILNISSMGAFQGSIKFPGLIAYASLKAALCVFSEGLAVELNDRDIRVNCLCLGAVETEMLKKAFPDYKAPVSAAEMGDFIQSFFLTQHKVMNGKIIPVALSNP